VKDKIVSVQDFYSNSNYVETFLAKNPNATPKDILPANKLTGDGLKSGSKML